MCAHTALSQSHTHAHYKVAEIYELHTRNIKPVTFSSVRGRMALTTRFSADREATAAQ